MNPRQFPFWLFMTIVVIMGLLLSACGGGTTEIKVGAPLPLTGPYASDGEQMLKALQMAVDEQNAKGGLLGRPLRLITGDVGALEAEKIKAVGERLIGEGVDVVITGYADSGVDARVFGEYDMPFLHADAMTLNTEVVAQDPEKYGNVFQYCPSEVSYGIDAAANLFKMGEKMGWKEPNKKIAIVKVDYSYNILAADKFAELAKDQGYEIVVDEVTQFGVVEWGPILSKIDNAQPAYVTFWNLDPTDAARFIVQFKERFGEKGLNALVFMQFTPSIPEFLELAGSAAEGLLWTASINPVGAGVEDYKQRWIAKYKEEPKSIYAYVTRDGFDIWVTAVEKAGCVDCYDKVVENIRNITYEGLAGVHVFTATDQQSKYGDDFIPTLWYQIWGGEHLVVGPSKYQKAQPQMPPWIK
ncbi:MAG: ABC transporter substrate-binding protein [Anaerolineales bacterium]|nr:ABC transporter substrate-binding protein [Anaerolineales bacterium]MDW8161263.1 ABC transporter substrate-binding protein [Anaerolineales bacterium]